MNDIEKALIAACATIGIDIGHSKEISHEQVTELSKILKDEYGIDISIVNRELEVLQTSMEKFIFTKKPALEFCGTPPDGRERRRERRKQERLLRKKINSYDKKRY